LNGQVRDRPPLDRLQRGLLRRIIRAYFDGRMAWLNKERMGANTRRGDLWGSIGA